MHLEGWNHFNHYPKQAKQAPIKILVSIDRDLQIFFLDFFFFFFWGGGMDGNALLSWSSWKEILCISSTERQKGVNDVQWCFIEKQKGAIITDFD